MLQPWEGATSSSEKQSITPFERNYAAKRHCENSTHPALVRMPDHLSCDGGRPACWTLPVSEYGGGPASGCGMNFAWE